MEAVFLEFAKLFGPVAALAAFFVWRDYVREQRDHTREIHMSERLSATEDFVRDRLTALIERTAVAINDNTVSSRELRGALNRRPCLLPEELKP